MTLTATHDGKGGFTVRAVKCPDICGEPEPHVHQSNLDAEGIAATTSPGATIRVLP